MNAKLLLPLALGLALAARAVSQEDDSTRVVVYPGLCEASGAVPIDAETFVVADDDEKDLRVYRLDAPAEPQKLKISDLADLSEKADLEGATKIGEDLYFIGSHSRNKNGEAKPGRHRLFAIRVQSQGGQLTPVAVGRPYKTLVEDLQKDNRFEKYKLGAASELPAEEAGGLNIEGLSATPDGKLLIGFRNPVRKGKALVVTLNNPRQVLDGIAASFGDPVELDLAGLGIRSLEHWPAVQAYVIVAGSSDDAGGRFQAYRWSGKTGGKPEPMPNVDFSGLTPEAIFFTTSPNKMIVLSDDGAVCPKPKGFRMRQIPLPPGS
jgi:hypothetical protein